MPANPVPDAEIEITAFDWVPDFALGHVRDIRPRWACEELGLPYRERLISAKDRPAPYYNEQPWGQVPYLRDGDIALFESGAMLIHLGERDERLLPRSGQARADTFSWLLAALNSIEPNFMELVNITVFSAGQDWAELRKPGLLEAIGGKLDRLAQAMGNREWLTGTFSIADIAMATVLRRTEGTDLLGARPTLSAYLDRALARPAYRRAHDAQLAAFANGKQNVEVQS